MQELPLTLRGYLWAIYGACAILVWQSLAVHYPVWSGLLVALQGGAVFVVLAYLGERITLQVAPSAGQSLGTAVHVALILLFPRPFPLLITLLAALVSQVFHGPAPLYKRAFNICHQTLSVGLCSILFSLVAAPVAVLRPDHLVAAIPALSLLIVLFYVLDVGPVMAVLALAQGRSAWRVWRQTHCSTLMPELAASTSGILAAVAWLYHPILLTLFVLPVIGLRVAFRAIRQAENRAESLRQVLVASQHLRLQHTPVDLLEPVAEAARALMGASMVTAYLRDEEDPELLKRVLLVPETGLPGMAAGTGPRQPGPAHMLLPASGRGIQQDVEGGQLTLRVPLEIDGAGVVGLLWVTGVPLRRDHADDGALAILATQAAIALENARLHERALAQASEDGLTGLLNHRAFQMRLDEEVAQARRGGHPLALMMVDLDDFGSINNAYGHQAGDITLAAIARALRASARGGDVVARYGGDEFALILPYTDAPEALAVAQRAHAAIRDLDVSVSGVTIRVNASMGIAALPTHARTREQLLRAADQAAYAAKHAGKGCVGRPEDAALTLDRDPDALATQLAHANLATVQALAAAVDAKDPYTRGHSQRVSAYAAAIAQALGLPAADIARVRLAGLLHDVGKIGVPDAILAKPGKLSAEEFAVLQQHPASGERMLSAVPFLRDILPAVRHHHERWDGRGYPDGLAGRSIPQDAAILMVADSFDAMTSSRIYRPALPLSEARRRIREGSGTQFDPHVVAAFDAALTGGILKPLSSGATVLLSRDYPAPASTGALIRCG